MNINKYRHIVFSMATGGLLLVGLFLLLNGAPQMARADAGDLFVSSAGSGDCSQGSPCDLQTALGTASDGDTIYIAGGVYTSTGGAVVTVTHSLALYGGWDGTLTTPPMRDPDAYPTTLDGEGARRVVFISGGISPIIDGFVITNGNAENETFGAGEGGGIYSKDASPTIRNNVIISNAASISPGSGSAGGIYLYGASGAALISDNQVLSNTAYSDQWDQGGGGLYLSYSDATISGNLFQGNTCSRDGGGIYVGCCGAPRILGNRILSNESQLNGGGIYARYSGLPHIEGNWICDNVAGRHGGGICVTNGSQPTIVANRVLSNTAGSGAGVLLETGGYYIVTNNFVAHNGSGSGIKIWDLTRYGLVAHNTVAFNAGAEGGIYLAHAHITPTLLCNIVVSNTYGIRAHSDASGTLDYNDVWGNTTQDYNLPGALEPGPHDIHADPMFVNAAGDDFHLQAGSPCTDAGTDAGVVSDIDGHSRPFGAGYDIGADESRPQWSLYLPLVVKNSS